MVLQIYTMIHTLISLVAIFTGFVVVFGLLAGKRLDGWTKCVSHHSRRDDDPSLTRCVKRSKLLKRTCNFT